MAKEMTKMYCPSDLLQVNSIILERRQNLQSLNLEISLTLRCPPPPTSLVGYPYALRIQRHTCVSTASLHLLSVA
jgi:hypothetical protein